MMNSFDSNLEHIINVNEKTDLIHNSEPTCGLYLYYFIIFSFTIVMSICLILLVIF